MKLVAKNRCQLDGRIYNPGDTAEYEGAITRRIAYNFKGADGGDLACEEGDSVKESGTIKGRPVITDEAKIEILMKTYSREQILAKLDELGAAYKPQQKTESLARIYLQAKGE